MAEPTISIGQLTDQYAAQFGLDPDLLRAVIEQESGGEVNPPDAGSGAVGLMQLMPDTATEVAASLGMNPAEVDLLDPETNIMLGAKYLSDQIKRQGGDVGQGLLAYHSGAKNVATGRIGPVGQAYAPNVMDQWLTSNPAGFQSAFDTGMGVDLPTSAPAPQTEILGGLRAPAAGGQAPGPESSPIDALLEQFLAAKGPGAFRPPDPASISAVASTNEKRQSLIQSLGEMLRIGATARSSDPRLHQAALDRSGGASRALDAKVEGRRQEQLSLANTKAQADYAQQVQESTTRRQDIQAQLEVAVGREAAGERSTQRKAEMFGRAADKQASIAQRHTARGAQFTIQYTTGLNQAIVRVQKEIGKIDREIDKTEDQEALLKLMKEKGRFTQEVSRLEGLIAFPEQDEKYQGVMENLRQDERTAMDRSEELRVLQYEAAGVELPATGAVPIPETELQVLNILKGLAGSSGVLSGGEDTAPTETVAPAPPTATPSSPFAEAGASPQVTELLSGLQAQNEQAAEWFALATIPGYTASSGRTLNDKQREVLTKKLIEQFGGANIVEALRNAQKPTRQSVSTAPTQNYKSGQF